MILVGNKKKGGGIPGKSRPLDEGVVPGRRRDRKRKSAIETNREERKEKILKRKQ